MESLVNKTTLLVNQDHIYDFFEEILERSDLVNLKRGVIKRAYINGLESLSDIELCEIKSYLALFLKTYTCPSCKNKNIKLITDFIFVSDYGMCPVCDYESDTFIV